MLSFLRAWLLVYPGPAVAAAARGARAAALAAASARRLWLFTAEVAGVVLGTVGIAQWSWPSAVIVGGLVMVAAVEVRPRVASAPPPIGLPGDLLHKQAEAAARAINSARYGVAEVRPEDLARLTDEDCDRLIAIARNIVNSP